LLIEYFFAFDDFLIKGFRFQVSGVRFQVSGVRCQQTVQQSGFMKLLFKLVWERFPTAIKIDPPQADSMFEVHWFFPTIKPAIVLAGGADT